MKIMRRFLSALCICALAHTAISEPRAFEVPAGDAATELREFAKQAGLQILFNFNAVTPIRTRAVSGEMEPEAALTQMIRGTGLEFERVNAQTVAIRQAAPGGTNLETHPARDLVAAGNTG